MKKALDHDIIPGDRVLFKNPKRSPNRPNPFVPANIIGTVKEVVAGGICCVVYGEEETTYERNVFVGQLVKWKDLDDIDTADQPTIDDTPMLTRIQLINKITDFSEQLRLDFYTSKLRSKITDRFEVNSLNMVFEAYDHTLLGQMSSNAEHHDMKFETSFHI